MTSLTESLSAFANDGIEEPAAGTTNDLASLQRLAQATGLALTYDDFWGAVVDVSPETLRRALHAMGVPAENDAAVAASLAQRPGHDAGITQALPPVVVVPLGHPDYCVPVAQGAIDAGWTLARENGATSVLQPQQHGDGMWRVQLPADLEPGYHRLLAGGGASDPTAQVQAEWCSVIVAPARCWSPEALQSGERWWGPCVQLYALRSSRNWGIGDLGDLRVLVDVMAAHGASFVGLNPLHALFPSRPEVASPYSPSTRNALNPLYLDVEAIADFAECTPASSLVDSDDFQRRLQQLRDSEMVDYTGVSAAKYLVLEKLWVHFSSRHLGGATERGQRFEAFARAPGHRVHALFEALQAHFFAADPTVWGWPAWPSEFLDRNGPAVQAFATTHSDRIAFHAWLQWQASLQLQAAHDRARGVGMALGLYRDLAVGVNTGGSETWAEPTAYAIGMHVGAPPDPLSAMGQDWGLPPLNPLYLQRGRYQQFIDTLRSNMRQAGALRLDHVMGLMRLFWTGEGGGTYMRYPLDDLLSILALESHRHHCLVIGEDLGNVAPSMREAMAARAVFSYKPLMFERRADGSFKPPHEWQAQALAVVSTHDMPTLRGFWRGEDIDIFNRLHLYPDDAARDAHIVSRAQERVQLLLALDRERLLPAGATVHPPSLPDCTPALVDAVHAYIARTPALLLGVQLEDLTQQAVQVNVPGTTEDQFPNWRRKLSVDVDALATDPRMVSLAKVLVERRRGPAPLQASSALELPDLATADIPVSTYRVQFHAGLTFEQVTAVVPYLDALGISHLYASPYLRARAGSTHGYDIVDHNALNPEVGDEAAFDRLCRALRRHGMRQMLDIVPNHMGVLEADNGWWLDVLENGPASVHAQTFDIEWHPAAPEMAGRVLLPVLGNHYGHVLEAAELAVHFDAEAGEFSLRYYDHRFPIDPRDYPQILAALPMPAPHNDAQQDAQSVVASLLHAFASLPSRNDTDAAARTTRERDRPLHKRALARHAQGQPWLTAWIAACLKVLNGSAGETNSFDALDALIGRQAYRLAYWRVAGDDINYRRFFDVNTLAGVNMERPDVFEATHRRVLRWLQEGKIAALRIDHPDGLSDPQQYFERVQARYAALADASGQSRRAIYLVVEKILAAHEALPAAWPVHGGTGYQFSSQATAVLVDGANEAAFDALYHAFTGRNTAFADVVHEAKISIIYNLLSSELSWLTETLYRITRSDRRTCDFTRSSLRRALALMAAGFPLYRTYLRAGDSAISSADRAAIDVAVDEAKRRSEGAEISVIDQVREVLLHAFDATTEANQTDAHGDTDRRRALQRRFVARWQQFTAPVMAKSLEDTAFYRFNRLVSLNDVGSDPDRFGISVESFHRACIDLKSRPHWLLATSTHDSKRSEDVRTRLNVLSETPAEWEAAIVRWRDINDQHRVSNADALAPSRNDEYLLYQTIVGAWPFGVDSAGVVDGMTLSAAQREDLRSRVQAYMVKATREAKQRTSWLNPDARYEADVAAFIDALFDASPSNRFWPDIQAFVERLALYGCWNSLSLVTLKLASPGVPDIYHGCEQWNFSLVDPDNRRPVDFERLANTLDALKSLFADGAPAPEAVAALRNRAADGHVKHLVTWRILQLRQQQPLLFERGGYTPLYTPGVRDRHVLAFERSHAGQRAVVITSRLLQTLEASQGSGTTTMGNYQPALWGDATLYLPQRAADRAGAPGPECTDWQDVITGQRITARPATDGVSIALADALRLLPVAVLVPLSADTAAA